MSARRLTFRDLQVGHELADVWINWVASSHSSSVSALGRVDRLVVPDDGVSIGSEAD